MELPPRTYHAIGEILAAHLDEFHHGGALLLRVGGQLPADGLAVGAGVLQEVGGDAIRPEKRPPPEPCRSYLNTHVRHVVRGAVGEGGAPAILL